MLNERKFDEKLLAVAKFYANPDDVFDDGNEDFAALVCLVCHAEFVNYFNIGAN